MVRSLLRSSWDDQTMATRQPPQTPRCEAGPATSTHKIALVPGPLLFDERNCPSTQHNRHEPWRSLVQRAGKEHHVTALVKRHERDHRRTVRENVLAVPGAAKPLVCYRCDHRRASPDDVDIPDGAVAPAHGDGAQVWAPIDEGSFRPIFPRFFQLINTTPCRPLAHYVRTHHHNSLVISWDRILATNEAFASLS